jgi:large subunit ribosomal protein L28
MRRAALPHLSTAPPRVLMNRARRGIFAGKVTRTGNNISFSYQHTRRTFAPNVQAKTYYSTVLEKRISLPVTTYAMRSIAKAGGLDAFLLYSKHVAESQVASSLKRQVETKLMWAEDAALRNGKPSSLVRPVEKIRWPALPKALILKTSK